MLTVGQTEKDVRPGFPFVVWCSLLSLFSALGLGKGRLASRAYTSSSVSVCRKRFRKLPKMRCELFTLDDCIINGDEYDCV